MAKMEAGGATRIFQALTVLGVGAFFYWLYVASEPTEFAVAEEGDDVPAIELSAMDFANDPQLHEGERVRFEGVEVTRLLRQNVYFLRLGEEGVPLLVRMSDDVARQPGFQPLPGDRGEVTGTLQEVNEDLIDQWNQAGVFRDAEELFEAQLQPVYLFVTAAELQPAPRPDETEEDEAEPA